MIPKSLLEINTFQAIQISILIVLLTAEIIYLLDKGPKNQTLTADLVESNYTTSLTALEQSYVEQNLSDIIVRGTLTHKQDTADVGQNGMIIFIPSNTCIQQLTSTLKQTKQIHKNFNTKAPMKVILVNHDLNDERNPDGGCFIFSPIIFTSTIVYWVNMEVSIFRYVCLRKSLSPVITRVSWI